ncbi:hypothetical protein EVAR_16706_1 [Eumeta japonica]|uniref:Uncharacterized protein n=1 Tax=Eumeta variegata TaxID=151549 RepID=A0A4C1V588_EUMVA|nr:hypothetical protein EVAR_16706_1 [Eumeta japonica]
MKKLKTHKRNRTKDWLKKEHYSHISLLNELKFAPKDWHNYLRMDEETYLKLLSTVTPYIKKQDTVMRQSISPHERLTATLRYLKTERSYEDLKFTTIISPQALGVIVPETCDAIYKILSKDYFKLQHVCRWAGSNVRYHTLIEYRCEVAAVAFHTLSKSSGCPLPLPSPHSPSTRYPIPTQDTENALLTPLGIIICTLVAHLYGILRIYKKQQKFNLAPALADYQTLLDLLKTSYIVT